MSWARTTHVLCQRGLAGHNIVLVVAGQRHIIGYGTTVAVAGQMAMASLARLERDRDPILGNDPPIHADMVRVQVERMLRDAEFGR